MRPIFSPDITIEKCPGSGWVMGLGAVSGGGPHKPVIPPGLTALASGADGGTYILQAKPRPQFSSDSAKYLKLDQDGNIMTCTAPGGTEQCAL